MIDTSLLESEVRVRPFPDRSLATLSKAYDELAWGKDISAANIAATWALKYDPREKDFAPTRNYRLVEALDLMRFHHRGESVGENLFREVLLERFEKARRLLEEGRLPVEVALRITPTEPKTARLSIDGVELRLTDYVQQRAIEWNEMASGLLKDKNGIIKLIDHPAVMVHTLGLGQWLDVGNLMLEPGLVGDRLQYPSSPHAVDLYSIFGVTPDTFVFFTHIKHRPGLYNFGKVDGPHLDIRTYVAAYERIAQLMRLNINPKAEGLNDVRLTTIISPGTWFYDPQLVSDPHMAYVQAIAGRVIPIGDAGEMGLAKQVEFAISSSKQRREKYNRRDASGERGYSPILTARSITLDQIDQLLTQKDELIAKFS